MLNIDALGLRAINMDGRLETRDSRLAVLACCRC
jgi:hypothetical protein